MDLAFKKTLLTKLADHGQVNSSVGHQVAHRADVLGRHVGQEGNLTGGLVRIDLRESDATENASGPISSRIVLRFTLFFKFHLYIENNLLTFCINTRIEKTYQYL